MERFFDEILNRNTVFIFFFRYTFRDVILFILMKILYITENSYFQLIGFKDVTTDFVWKKYFFSHFSSRKEWWDYKNTRIQFNYYFFSFTNVFILLTGSNNSNKKIAPNFIFKKILLTHTIFNIFSIIKKYLKNLNAKNHPLPNERLDSR